MVGVEVGVVLLFVLYQLVQAVGCRWLRLVVDLVVVVVVVEVAVVVVVEW